MRIKIIGSGASEGVPAMFCKCNVCLNARKKAGKEKRHRAGVLIDEVLMIDFSPDVFSLAYQGLDVSKVRNLLITHTHSDHYNYTDLYMREQSNMFGEGTIRLNVYGNKRAEKIFRKFSNDRLDIQNNTDFKLIKIENPIQIENYTVTAFGTRHMEDEICYNYLVEDGQHSYLHLADSDLPKTRVYEYLKDKNIKLSVVLLDCTFGSLKEKFYGHMNLWQNIEVKSILEKSGLVDSNTKFVANHISHYSRDTHDSLSNLANNFNIKIAYDNLEIDIKNQTAVKVK